MAALRCSICGINWPPQRQSYAKCPACEETTGYLSDATPLDHDEAQKRKMRLERAREPQKDMSAALEKYRAEWANHKSGPPDADPREAHHATNRRWPAFERLCSLAQARKVHVALRVTDQLAVKAENKERRELYEIALIAAGREISSEPIRSGSRADLNETAESLTPILTAGLGQVESD